MFFLVRKTLGVAILTLFAAPCLGLAQEGRTKKGGRPFGATGKDRPFGATGRLPGSFGNRTFSPIGRDRSFGSLSDRPLGDLGRERPFGGSDELADRAAPAPDEDRGRNERGRRHHVVFWRTRSPIWEAQLALGLPDPPGPPDALIPEPAGGVFPIGLVRGPMVLGDVSVELDVATTVAQDRGRVDAALDRSVRHGWPSSAASLWADALRGEWNVAASGLTPAHVAFELEFELGSRAEALHRALERALARDPEDRDALWLHAAYHASRRDFANLELDLRSLRQLTPGDPRMRWLEDVAIELLARR